MDGLLLLADMTTAMGYEGTRRFRADARTAISRARATMPAPHYAYPGVQIVHPRLFADAPQGAFSTNMMWDRAIAEGRLFGTVLDGVWIHVGTPQARDEAEASLAALSRRETARPSSPSRPARHFARNAGAGPDRARRRRSAGAVVGDDLSADPARGAQLRRCLCRGAGRRGAAAAIPRRWATARKTNCCSMPPAKAWSWRPPSRRCGGNCCWRGWCGNGIARRAAARLSFAQSAALADSLAKVMDEVETQGCDLSKLKDLAPRKSGRALGRRHALPGRDARCTGRPSWRKKRRSIPPRGATWRLQALAQRLEASPPPGLVIAAGSTGSIPATAELLARDRAPAQGRGGAAGAGPAAG